MCGRIRIKDAQSVRTLLQWLADGVFTWQEIVQRWQICPDTLQKVVEEDGFGPTLQDMRWGFVPSWEKSPKPKIAPINARSGEAFNKPFFKQSIQKRRCLIPCDGFYEWPKVETGRRQPAFFSLKEEKPFFMAGLFSDAVEGVRPKTFTILTTEPNELLLKLPHERMPVILEPEKAREWLRPGPITESDFLSFCRPYPADKMQSWPVSTLVNKPQNQGPEVCAPVAEEAPPPTQSTFDL